MCTKYYATCFTMAKRFHVDSDYFALLCSCCVLRVNCNCVDCFFLNYVHSVF